MPTVVVSRTARAGREAEFARWLGRLTTLAAGASGHVDSSVEPPDANHPGEWLVVYRFDSVPSLQAFLQSPERTALLKEGAELTDGPPRQQLMATAPADKPVTAVSSFRVAKGAEAQWQRLQRRLDDAVRQFPGFVGIDRFEPVPGVQEETVVVFSFDTRKHLEDWLASATRAELLAAVDKYVEGPRTFNVLGAFGGWFHQGQAPVKRWKQACVVLLALYPTVLALTLLSRWLIPNIWWPLGVLLSNIAGVGILTWLLMPPLTRWLAPWLHR